MSYKTPEYHPRVLVVRELHGLVLVLRRELLAFYCFPLLGYDALLLVSPVGSCLLSVISSSLLSFASPGTEPLYT